MRKFSVRRIILILIDLICIILASFLALFLRFNGEIPSYYFNILKNLMGLEIFISLVIFYLFKLYRSLWQFASINELKNILSAAVIDSIANVFLFEIADKSLPLSCYFIYFLLITMFLGITRLIYRMTRLYRTEKGSDNYKERRSLEKVMIIGAGMAG